ncbi:hypothetical protein HPP92_021319 [Vanilla planifolia]|uniref:Uncharacterized protein n=1 Tax=Vanilla planifolia TaxID=51239 RepID=A0A835Q5D1_VANPL|nr:hypothetical protein HPP92_021319 [Vanilla planifolia]
MKSSTSTSEQKSNCGTQDVWMIHRKPEIDAYEMSGVVLDDTKGDIKLKNVYFSYPARADQLPPEKLLHTSPASR